MTTMPATQDQPKRERDACVAAFEQFEKRARWPSWVQALRQGGIARFAELGFPTVRHEEWKYTNVAPIAKLPFKPVAEYSRDGLSSEALEQFSFGGMPGLRLVFVNGHYSTEFSKVPAKADGLKAGSLAAALHTDADLIQQHLGRYARGTDNAFPALNTAFFQDGAFVRIPAGLVLEEPVHLLFLATTHEAGAAVQPRNLILAEKQSQATVIEHYVSLADAPYFTNAVTEMVLGDNAVVEHCKIQDESAEAFHIATIQAQQNRNSRVQSHSISIGARLARNNINLVLAGEGCDSILNGLYIVKGDQLVDHHTVADHTQPRCNSHEFYHGILDGKAHGVFNGKIFVRPGAQKTDAKQTNKNLLLSCDATVDTKPQLEIFADDVKCTHGATVGQLDDEAIFYLRSRGIGLDTARKMLVHAFASDIINRIKVAPVREALDRALFGRIEEDLQFAETL